MAASPNTLPSSAPKNVKLLCSYGGKILPRPSDGRLRYVGGVTRVLCVAQSISFSDLTAKLDELCGYSVRLRCQLPSEDMDVLVSIKLDEDLSHVIEEYQKASLVSGKELKIRAILFSPNSASPSPSSSPSAYSSCSSSSSASRSPSRINQYKPPTMAEIHRFPARKAQYGTVPCGYNHFHYPCRVQAGSWPVIRTPYFSQPAYRYHDS